VWEYHGPLECEEVETILTVLQGPEAAAKWKADYSELDEVRVIVYFCDGKLLKIEPDWLLDTNESLYSVVSFEKSETSRPGRLRRAGDDARPGAGARAAWRMLMDNSGLSVGPQIVIDKARSSRRTAPGRSSRARSGTKSGDDINENSKSFEIFNIPSNTDELVKTIELCLKFIDETTSLPLIAQGEQGAHITQTAGGMSMLMNSANVIFRNVVKNFDDDMTTPLIRRFYDWNMQFNPKEEIKGDLQVEARGTSALLVRELQSANLMAIAERWSSIRSSAWRSRSTTRCAWPCQPEHQPRRRARHPRRVRSQAQAAAGERAAGSAHRGRADRRQQPQGAERRQRRDREPAPSGRDRRCSRRAPARPARRSRPTSRSTDEIQSTKSA
jgi:hypothetical protein